MAKITIRIFEAGGYPDIISGKELVEWQVNSFNSNHVCLKWQQLTQAFQDVLSSKDD